MILQINKGISNCLKFFAAIIVVFHHYSQYALSEIHNDNFFFRFWSFLGGYLGVAIFFFLSGYGLMMSETTKHLNIKEFLKKRFIKIYVPVLEITAIWLGIILVTLWVSPSNRLEGLTGLNAFTPLNGESGRYKLLLFSLLQIPLLDGVLWFVKILFLLYLSFMLFTLFYREKRIYSWLTLLAGVILSMIWAQTFIGRFAVYSIPFFGIGVFAAAYRHCNFKALNLCLVFILIYMGIAYLLDWPLITFINGIVIAIIIIVCTKWNLEIFCPAVFAATSFDCYLIHNKVLMLGRSYMQYYPFLHFIILTCVSVMIWHFIKSKKFYQYYFERTKYED